MPVYMYTLVLGLLDVKLTISLSQYHVYRNTEVFLSFVVKDCRYKRLSYNLKLHLILTPIKLIKWSTG